MCITGHLNRHACMAECLCVTHVHCTTTHTDTCTHAAIRYRVYTHCICVEYKDIIRCVVQSNTRWNSWEWFLKFVHAHTWIVIVCECSLYVCLCVPIMCTSYTYVHLSCFAVIVILWKRVCEREEGHCAWPLHTFSLSLSFFFHLSLYVFVCVEYSNTHTVYSPIGMILAFLISKFGLSIECVLLNPNGKMLKQPTATIKRKTTMNNQKK